MGVVMRLALLLPRDRYSVPLTRRVLDAALGVLGVSRDCRSDIGLVVGEACANVVEHAQEGNGFEVTITIEDDRCVIDVADDGVGLDLAEFERTAVDGDAVGPDAETGRGLRIIRVLADAVELRKRAPRGVTLRIIKLLRQATPATV